MPRLLILAGLVLLTFGCRNQDEGGAIALWEDFQAADYRSWERAPGYAERTPSGAPHGDAVDIFINDTLAEALASGDKLSAWPEGSLIIKDGYKKGDPYLVAVMEKRGDGWFWAEYEPDGEVLFSGEPGVCTRCHDGGADFVRAFGFP